MNLKNKQIIVTGGTGRLGRIIVHCFQEAGATVISVERKSRTASHPVVVASNLADEAVVQQAFQHIEDQFGRPDALVHAVGMWAGQPFLDTALADWQRIMDVNLTSAFLCFREATRIMQPETSNPKRLIGIVSAQGADRGVAQQAAYSTSKAGLIRLVESVAAEYVGAGLTAHAIAPSTLLFDDDNGAGVQATQIAQLCLDLCGGAGDALNGATLRAYGTGF